MSKKILGIKLKGQVKMIDKNHIHEFRKVDILMNRTGAKCQICDVRIDSVIKMI